MSGADTAADIVLETLAGARVTLRDAIGAQPTLVVLLRHLECPFCEAHLSRLVASRDELGRIIVVSFASPERLREYAATLPAEFLVLRDSALELYGALGLRRGGLWRVLLTPRVSLRLVGLALRGRTRFIPREDSRQLGGDAVFGPGGELVWMHASTGPEDRPAIKLVAAAMDGVRTRSSAA